MNAPIAAKLMVDKATDRPFVVNGPFDPSPQYLMTDADARKQTLAALIGAAIAAQAAGSEPWSKAVSWQADTTYFKGTVVRGIGAGNTDNLFLCVQTGASAGAVGPVGRGAAGIVDNATRWLHLGVGVAQSAVPLWATAAPVNAASVMDGYLAIVAGDNLATLGLTRAYPMTFAGGWAGNITGGVGLQADGGGIVDVIGPNAGTLAAPVRHTSMQRWSIHVQTDCRKWFGFQPNGALYPRRFYVEVNGRPLTEGQVGHNTTLGGGSYLLDLSRFAGVKDIRIYGYGSLSETVAGWVVGADEAVWTPDGQPALSIALEGDSITQGGGTSDALMSNFIEHLICRSLGIDKRYNNAIGGTGVISNQNGNATTYLQRIADVAAVNPDIVLVGGFHNDDGQAPATTRAAILTYLRRLRALCPRATVFVVGTQMLGNEGMAPGSAHHTLEQTALSAFTEWADDNAAFIPLLTQAQPFPPTTADGWYYQDALAAPFNDAHPTPRYYPAYAAIVVQAIKKYFQR